MQTLYIIRGLPGSGKSTLAAHLMQRISAVHVEADQYFISNGVYIWRPEEIGDAHEWCEDTVRLALDQGKTVIVSNTGTTFFEVVKYVYMAKASKVQVVIIECTASYGSIHGVPKETLAKMARRWVTNEKLKELFDKEHEVYTDPILYAHSSEYHDAITTASPPIC